MTILSTDEIVDFGGGLDLISSISQIPPGYTPNAMNFRIAEYGGIEKTLGYAAFADLGSGVSGNTIFDFTKRDGSFSRMVVGSATKWQSINASGTVADVRTGLTSVSDTTFVSYEDKLYGLDVSNALASWDGTTVDTASFATAPKGLILGVWQNRLFIAVATAGKVGTRVQWSAIGDFTSWPAANFVDLGGPGTTELIVGGVPIADGLVVFTNSSTYIVYDSASGANSLVDPQHGCSSRQSLAVVDGMIYGINTEGVFRTNGRFPLEIISRRVSPLFLNERPDLSTAAGVRWFNSYMLSYKRSGTYNNLTLEFTPSMARVDSEPPCMASEYRGHSYTTFTLSSQLALLFIDAGNRRYVRRAFSGGSFLSTASPGVAAAISAYYELPWDNFGAENRLKRLQKVRVVGRGAITVGVKGDYASTMMDSGQLSFPSSSGGVWDTDVWDSFTWGGYGLYEGWARIQLRGRRFSLRIQESSSNSYPARDNLNATGTGTLGGAGVYLLEPHYSVSSRHR